MNEAEIKLEVRLGAIEHMLGNLYVNFYKAFRLPEAQIEKAHEKLLESTRTETLNGSDPALSDLGAGEYHEAVERLVKMIEELRGAAKTEA
jgi:hypothetical protein